MAPTLLPDRTVRPWALPRGAPSIFSPVDEWGGRDQRYPLTVGYATADGCLGPKTFGSSGRRVTATCQPAPARRRLPRRRGVESAICGPAGDEPPVRAGSISVRSNGSRMPRSTSPRVMRRSGSSPRCGPSSRRSFPGLRNAGMFASHELRDGVPARRLGASLRTRTSVSRPPGPRSCPAARLHDRGADRPRPRF